MSSANEPYPGINLFVPGRITQEDAQRQTRTAGEILRRLDGQPGVILADEVGMGKTFVALAVAVSVALADAQKRPIVVMVPPSLKEKWPRDFKLFKERCLPENIATPLLSATADRAVSFLKLLDDPPERRKSIIFLTHGAMYRGLQDHWVQLAIIQRALQQNENSEDLRSACSKFAGELLRSSWVSKRSPQVWKELLETRPEDWLSVLLKHGIDPEGDNDPTTDDDPIPQVVIDALKKIDAGAVYQALKSIPLRRSKHFSERMQKARMVIRESIRDLWKKGLSFLDFTLPLLILDEAHHLKNPATRFASLFQDEEAKNDAIEISRGPLSGVFEKMLFLTATPFQLGHHELCSVLERFSAVAWRRQSPGGMERDQYSAVISRLRLDLDRAQEAALRLENAWSLLKKEDLPEAKEQSWTAPAGRQTVGEDRGENVEENAPLGNALQRYEQAHAAMKRAESSLHPWVIRHNKKKSFPFGKDTIPRREFLRGDQISHDRSETQTRGLTVEDEALLPFLLSARVTTCNPDSRPVFAEGLASSYEAFLHTRRRNFETKREAMFIDQDDEPLEAISPGSIGEWYLNQLETILPRDSVEDSLKHPKIFATVNRVVDLWKQGEKVLVFCHYIATGRVLRQHISDAVRIEIKRLGSAKYRGGEGTLFEYLDKLGKKFFDEDTLVRRYCDECIHDLLSDHGDLKENTEKLTDIVRRYIRTPSFLVRFFPLDERRMNQRAVDRAFNARDKSGLALKDVIDDFFHFLSERCGEEERISYINALDSVQTGSIAGRDVIASYGEDEIAQGPGRRTEHLLPNVRLVNGSTKAETRQKLMLTFNTPFFPEVLIASSVMAEGVDLHLNCRHVIHHDLCWNPSTLEQRTGRVDRIGAKIERCGSPLRIYLPFIAETQDEKMYRVVMDRERWFKVVMGEKIKMDARSTDKLAARVPLPEAAAEELMFKLDV